MIDASLGTRFASPWSSADIALAQPCTGVMSGVPYFAIKFGNAVSHAT